MNVCTIIAKNYVAHARVLARSLKEHHPDATCWVLVVDETDGWIDPAAEPFELVRPDEIGLDDFGLMASRYDVLELSTAVKPWLLRTLLERGDHVVYLDPDIRIFGDVAEIEELARAHDLVLTPHNTTAMPRDGLKPAETDILVAGAYNLGFVAMGAGEQTRAVLDWWSQRLEHDCIVDPERGYFVDQRWMDFVPGMVEDVHILRDDGYNVAYWNLASRTLERSNGHVAVNGRPLRFFHYSGFDPRNAHLLSKHQNRVSLADDAVLRALCDRYATELRDNGFDEVVDWPYTYAVTPSGLQLDRALRRLHGAGQATGELTQSCFSTAGEQEFLDWLVRPAEGAGESGVNRFMKGVWDTRPDLQQAYPEPLTDHAEGLRGWFDVEHRARRPDLPERLIPRTEHTTRPVEDIREPGLPFGVNVVGYLNSELGVGEVARQAIGALDAAAVPVLPIGEVATASRQGHDYVHRGTGHNPFAYNLLCVNADQTEAFAQRAGEGFFEGRHTIGWWWWEVARFREEWLGAFDHVDELWAGSRFIADALGKIAPVPVTHVPLPVTEPRPVERDREKLTLPGGFTFLYVYDYNSVFARKNPLGAVEAFKRAFPEPGEAYLVLKCINQHNASLEHEQVRVEIADRPDVVCIDRYVSVAEKNGLIAACDAYVSLHRSEGFGITMAEAMLFERPVIATGYSGNADFVRPDTAWPVDFTLVPIGPRAAPYPADGEWAEPDLDHAARCMREVFEDRDGAAARAAAGARFIREHHSPAATGAAMRARLEALREAGRPEPLPYRGRIEQSIDELADLVHRGVPRSTRPKPLRAVRAAALRAMRPYTEWRRRLDETTIHVLRHAVEDLERRRDAAASAEAAAQSQLLAGVRSLERRLEELRTREADDVRRLEAGVVRQLDAVLAETRQPPYMEGRPLERFDAGRAGRVLGWRGGGEHHGGYASFEDVFRGSEEVIRARQEVYADLLRGHEPILDVGCGRGEFLDVAREHGLTASGVDLDASMAERARAKGHDVEVADGLERLRALDEGALGALVSFQVVEHLPADGVTALFAEAHRALAPGGLLIAETVNPHSAAALKAFWVDPTHQHPLFPEVLLVLLRDAGFSEAYAFCPNGSGDWDADVWTEGEYAVVATR